MYYECHITLKDVPTLGMLGHELRDLKKEIEVHGWKFSRIAGDPVLKDAAYCYATKHVKPSVPLIEVIVEMNMTARALGLHWTVVRQKVELVVYDEKTITVEEKIG
jgi:hypothetical protein